MEREDERVQQRNDRVLVCPLAQISDLGFSDVRTAAAANWMRARERDRERCGRETQRGRMDM